jgi:nucleoid-associated protein YgaU
MKKLSITSCSVDEAGNVKADGSTCEVLINPAGYSHDREIYYSQKKHLGALAPKTEFSAMEAETVSFDEIIIDGTGVVRPSPGGAVPDVKTQLKQLTDVVYKYSGNKHEPPWVRLLWGTLIFFGRLTSMSVDYTLFKPSGEALRAKLKLSFRGAMSPQEEALRANRSSPDLSHRVVVRAGDTLPLLCYRIYRDSSYYPEVARLNQLSDFRNLKPGSRLVFPPLG